MINYKQKYFKYKQKYLMNGGGYVVIKIDKDLDKFNKQIIIDLLEKKGYSYEEELGYVFDNVRDFTTFITNITQAKLILYSKVRDDVYPISDEIYTQFSNPNKSQEYKLSIGFNADYIVSVKADFTTFPNTRTREDPSPWAEADPIPPHFRAEADAGSRPHHFGADAGSRPPHFGAEARARTRPPPHFGAEARARPPHFGAEAETRSDAGSDAGSRHYVYKKIISIDFDKFFDGGTQPIKYLLDDKNCLVYAKDTTSQINTIFDTGNHSNTAISEEIVSSHYGSSQRKPLITKITIAKYNELIRNINMVKSIELPEIQFKRGYEPREGFPTEKIEYEDGITIPYLLSKLDTHMDVVKILIGSGPDLHEIINVVGRPYSLALIRHLNIKVSKGVSDQLTVSVFYVDIEIDIPTDDNNCLRCTMKADIIPKLGCLLISNNNITNLITNNYIISKSLLGIINEEKIIDAQNKVDELLFKNEICSISLIRTIYNFECTSDLIAREIDKLKRELDEHKLKKYKAELVKKV